VLTVYERAYPCGWLGILAEAAPSSDELVYTYHERGRSEWLDDYSEMCVRRVWKAQRFSWWMTSTLHRFPDESAFDHQRQIADLDYLTGSHAAMTSLAEQYVGLPAEVSFESAGLPAATEAVPTT
jgi:hypothetical protein